MVLLLLAAPLYAGGEYGFPDPNLNEEFDKNYYEHKYPNWVYAKGSSMTVVFASGTVGSFNRVDAVGARITGVSVLSTGGAALELLYSGGSILNSYTRSTNLYNQFSFAGSSFTFTNGGATTFVYFDSAGTDILGTNTNDGAAAGYVGEYIQSVVSGVAGPSTGQYKDITTISLTAGDWDVSMLMVMDGTGVTITGTWDGGISIGTAGNAFSDRVSGSNAYLVNPAAINTNLWSIPTLPVSVAATTIVRMKSQLLYSAGAPAAAGRLSARRVR